MKTVRSCFQKSLWNFTNKWCLYTAPATRIGHFDDLYALFDILYQDLMTVETGNTDENEWGAVYIFIKRGKPFDKVVSSWSSVNKQYDIFMQLKTILTEFWSNNRKITQLDENLENEYSQICIKFIEQLFEYNKNIDINDNLSMYWSIIDSIFESAKKDTRSRKNLWNKYPQFLASILGWDVSPSSDPSNGISTLSKIIDNQPLIGYRKSNHGEIVK